MQTYRVDLCLVILISLLHFLYKTFNENLLLFANKLQCSLSIVYWKQTCGNSVARNKRRIVIRSLVVLSVFFCLAMGAADAAGLDPKHCTLERRSRLCFSFSGNLWDDWRMIIKHLMTIPVYPSRYRGYLTECFISHTSYQISIIFVKEYDFDLRTNATSIF